MTCTYDEITSRSTSVEIFMSPHPDWGDVGNLVNAIKKYCDVAGNVVVTSYNTLGCAVAYRGRPLNPTQVHCSYEEPDVDSLVARLQSGRKAVQARAATTQAAPLPPEGTGRVSKDTPVDRGGGSGEEPFGDSCSGDSLFADGIWYR